LDLKVCRGLAIADVVIDWAFKLANYEIFDRSAAQVVLQVIEMTQSTFTSLPVLFQRLNDEVFVSFCFCKKQKLTNTSSFSAEIGPEEM